MNQLSIFADSAGRYTKLICFQVYLIKSVRRVVLTSEVNGT